jgi:hypothetical protein
VPELAPVVLGRPLGREARRISLEQLTDLGQAGEVADVDARHEHPAAGEDLDEVRLCEHPHRLADRGATHAELLHQLRLVQNCARRQLEGDDHVPNRVVGAVGERTAVGPGVLE